MKATQDTQSQQGQVSAPATEPKDEKQTKTERRAFLKCNKILNDEIAHLEPEEKAALVTFLKGLWEVDRLLTPDLVKFYLSLTQAIVERSETKAKEEKARQKERKHRDSLTGQAKVDYVVEKLRTEDIGLYRASFQREVLELMRDDKPIPTEEHYTFKAKTVNERFEGCSEDFQRQVIDEYLTKVLPEMEAEQQKEDAEQEAYDNLRCSMKR